MQGASQQTCTRSFRSDFRRELRDDARRKRVGHLHGLRVDEVESHLIVGPVLLDAVGCFARGQRQVFVEHVHQRRLRPVGIGGGEEHRDREGVVVLALVGIRRLRRVAGGGGGDQLASDAYVLLQQCGQLRRGRVAVERTDRIADVFLVLH